MKTETPTKKPEAAKPTPILALLPDMPSGHMEKLLQVYSHAAQQVHAKSLADLNLEIGREVHEKDTARRTASGLQKSSTARAKQLAHDAHQKAIRAAKGAFDREVASIEAGERAALSTIESTFTAAVAPLETELKKRADALGTEFGERLQVAVAEFSPLVAVARINEAEAAKKRAEYQAEMEAKKKAREEAATKTTEAATA